jgi:hypothetical protein
MKLPEIKRLVKEYSLAQLQQAEQDLLNERQLQIEVVGEDEGEQLTHIIGALEIAQHIEGGMAEKDALRSFTQRVRNSIS